MLNLGLIGNIQQMKSYINKAYELPEINISGISPVGKKRASEDFRLPVPEFSHLELIKRADALFVSRLSLLSFQIISDIIRDSKSVFVASYPGLSPEECSQLNKLALEAQTIIQVVNPFFYLPAVQWLNQNLKKPTYIDISFSKKEEGEFDDLLLQLLLMLKEMTDGKPKKTNAIFFERKVENEIFRNINLEYSDGSIVNLNIKYPANQDEFTISTFARNQFTSFDLIRSSGTCNNSAVELHSSADKNEVSVFFDTVAGSKNNITNLDDYSAVKQVVNVITSRLDKYAH